MRYWEHGGQTEEAAIETRIQLAKLIGDIATGQVQESEEDSPKVARARKGGERGGNAQAAKLTPEQRVERIARVAAEARRLLVSSGAKDRNDARMG